MAETKFTPQVCKGLICGFGRWADAFRPVGNEKDVAAEIARTPQVWFTVGCLASAGISTFILAATPESVSAFQDVLDDGSRFGARISYILLDDDGDLAQALSTGCEFISQSSVVIAGAGSYMASENFDIQLRYAVRRNKGVTILSSADGCAGALTDGVAVADSRSHQIARQVLSDSGSSAGLSEIVSEYRSLNACELIDLEGESFPIGSADARQLSLLRPLSTVSD